jgi:hypothetical protein
MMQNSYTVRYPFINPLTDEQHFYAITFLCILMHEIYQVCHFSSLSVFCLGFKRPAGELLAG